MMPAWLRWRIHLTAVSVLLLAAPIAAEPVSYTPGEIVIRMKSAASRPTSGTLQRLADRFSLQSTHQVMRTGLAPPTGASAKATAGKAAGPAYVLRFTSSEDARLIALAYAADPAVDYAEPNYHFHPLALRAGTAPNDPRYPEQTALSVVGYEALRDNLGPKARDIILAVIDSGVDIAHEDLAAAVWVNAVEAQGQPGVDDDGNGYVDDIRGWDFTDAPGLPGKGDWLEGDADVSDESGHGTQVSGVALAVADNGVGIAGVSDAWLMPLRAGLNLQSGESLLEEDDLAAAIVYAVDNGAHILNLSWGGPENARLIRDAIRYAIQRGVVVIASAGNSGAEGVLYPGRLDETITVGATDNSDNGASFSSRGNTVDLVAPGVSILSTLPGNAYGARSGTSFSAPMVSGIAAMLLSRDLELDSEDIRGLLTAGTIDLGENGWDSRFGNGRIKGETLLALSAPVSGRIHQPQTDASADGAFDIVASTSALGNTGYRLSWGSGSSPSVWNPLSQGGPGASIATTWDVSNIPEGEAVLRLEIDAPGGRVLEDRVEVRVDRALPNITGVEVVPVYDGRRQTHRISWFTNVPAEGAVLLTRTDGPTDTLRTPHIHTQQRIILPPNLVRGERVVQIRAVTPGGAETILLADTIDVSPLSVPLHGFETITSLPHAFLPDRASDFNGNGRLDLALMPYVDGTPFSVVEIFERAESGAFTRVHTTEESYLPWNVGDADNDGTADIVGTGVAQVRVFTGQPFPETQTLDMLSTWGGELADLDGNGTLEILARAQAGRRLLVLEHQSGSGFSQTAEIVDPTGGGGALGTRFVTADLDGDGMLEILVGDADGDLWIAEWDGSGFAHTWEREGSHDARWVGGGKDLDGDGQVEFAVLRAHEDFDDLLNGYWELEIYSATSDNTFQREFVTGFTGVITSGNGISAGDLDGDGISELVVSARPDLYVFQGNANVYEPIWYAPTALLHRPLVTDLDGDTASEIVYNAPVGNTDSVRVVRKLSPSREAPLAFSEAAVLGPDRVRLQWTSLPEAISYQVHRSESGQPFLAVATGLLDPLWVDTGLVEGNAYDYQVVALLPNVEVAASDTVTLIPTPGAEILSMESPAAGRIRIRFSRPMAPSAFDPDRYRLLPEGGAPSSAAAAADNAGALLTFPSGLGSGGLSHLTVTSVSDTGGVLLGQGEASILFVNDPSGPVIARHADFDRDGRVGFGDFLMFARAFGKENDDFDLNRDRHVTFSDFLIFALLFGQSV